jgi:hypothetical protein
MNKAELILVMFCIMGCAMTLEQAEAKAEQDSKAAGLAPDRQHRILNNIRTTAHHPAERRLTNQYLMSSIYNSMMLNYMGFGMSPHTYSPYSMYHMGGMMHPMYSSMMYNPMMMGMYNPMMMGMYNPMMMGMMGMFNPWMMGMNNQNTSQNENKKSKSADNSAASDAPEKKEAEKKNDEKKADKSNGRKLGTSSEFVDLGAQSAN